MELEFHDDLKNRGFQIILQLFQVVPLHPGCTPLTWTDGAISRIILHEAELEIICSRGTATVGPWQPHTPQEFPLTATARSRGSFNWLARRCPPAHMRYSTFEGCEGRKSTCGGSCAHAILSYGIRHSWSKIDDTKTTHPSRMLR
jgi:hypothetical protein